MSTTEVETTAKASHFVSLECNRERLIEALNTVAPFAPTRSPKPILKNVCFDVSQESSVVMATDRDTGCRLSLDGAIVAHAGRFSLPPGQLLSLLGWMPDTTVQIHASKDGVVIRGERGEHRFPFEDPDEFPAVPEFKAVSYHEVPAELFCILCRRTVFATDSENSRYALGAVSLEMNAQRITGIATDGRRLSVMEGPALAVAPMESQSDKNILIPSRAMAGMEKVFAGDNAILIASGEHTAVFKGQRATVSTRMAEGRFPRWNDVVPRGAHYTGIDFMVSDLLSYLSEASIFVNSELKGVEWSLSVGQLDFKIKAWGGSSSVSMPVVYSDGREFQTSLDSKYVAEFLRTLRESQNVTMRFGKTEEPVAFVTDDGSQYIVMADDR